MPKKVSFSHSMFEFIDRDTVASDRISPAALCGSLLPAIRFDTPFLIYAPATLTRLNLAFLYTL